MLRVACCVSLAFLLSACEEGIGLNITLTSKDKEKDANSAVSFDINGTDIKVSTSSAESFVSNGKKITVESGDSVKFNLDDKMQITDAQVDWTPLFQSWENGCDEPKELVHLFENLDKENRHRFANLSQPYKNAIYQYVEVSQKEDPDAYMEYTVNIVGKYYGMPVKKIGKYQGFLGEDGADRSPGLRGHFLVLAVPLDYAKQTLGNQRVHYRPQTGELPYEGWGQASISGDTKETFITCDWSV